ncbi:MAG TPA: hypothetical protein VHB25_08580 [Gemmatimonadaceae bacterium]|nr:hypothetical protein [Gemmatimonadaceae bacterium]
MAKMRKRPPESWSYVLRADRALPFDQQSRFTLSPLSHGERAAMRDDLVRTRYAPDGSRDVAPRTHQNARELVLGHLTSIENFPVSAAQPWPSDREARERYLELLEDDDVLELGDEIWARSTLGPEEPAVGNSWPPERTSSSGGTSAVGSSTTAASAHNDPS